MVTACGGGSPPIPLAPHPAPRISASDGPTPEWNLCDRLETVLTHEVGHPRQRTPWGHGEEMTFYRPTAGHDSEYHLFFDDRGLLVGYIGVVYEGLDLASQPAYAAWTAQQIATDFVLPAGVPGGKTGLRSGRLYADQGERISVRAIIIPREERQILYIDSSALTPYAPLLSPYKPEYLARIHRSAPTSPSPPGGGERLAESESRASIARQHFAKGEVAYFALCSEQQVATAIEAYTRAIEVGLSEPLYQAEAHHRLGLAYRDKGLLPEAAAAIEASLKIRPAIPEVVNHLGKVYALMGDRVRAVESFQTAIGLRPNYAHAHFNLAEAIEETQPRRALIAYENYLAYVEESPGEQDRMAKAKERVKALRKH